MQPARLLRAVLTVNTGAIGVTSSHVVIPGAGPGQRYRIWGAHLGSTAVRTGNLLAILEDSDSPSQLVYLNAPVGGSDDWWPTGGYPLPEGSGLTATIQGSVATQPIRLHAYYTVESVAP